MNEFKRRQIILGIVLIIAIVGGIVLGILTNGREEEKEETIYEKIFKLSAFLIVMLAIIMYWVLPNTRIAKHFKMNESLFVASHILGMVCGAFGLASTFLWQKMVVKAHLFEFIVILFGLIFVYWAMILRVRKSGEISDILDEKQIGNIIKAAAATLLMVTCVMLIMYFISWHRVFVLEGKTWFLCYFFMALLIYSVSTLYYFKKA